MSKTRHPGPGDPGSTPGDQPPEDQPQEAPRKARKPGQRAREKIEARKRTPFKIRPGFNPDGTRIKRVRIKPDPSSRTFQPTALQRSQVELAISTGMPKTAIAAMIGCGFETLEKHFATEIENGMWRTNMRVAVHAMRRIAAGSDTLIKFWLSSRAGFAERSVVENQGQADQKFVVVLHKDATPKMLEGVAKLMPDEDQG